MSIHLDTRIARHEDVFAGEIDDELVMVSIATGSYYVLNATARDIWSLLEAPLSISEICARLVAEYEVDPQSCQKEVMNFVEKLLEKQIVKIT